MEKVEVPICLHLFNRKCVDSICDLPGYRPTSGERRHHPGHCVPCCLSSVLQTHIRLLLLAQVLAQKLLLAVFERDDQQQPVERQASFIGS